MSVHDKDRTNVNPFTINPQEFNQFILDYACGNVHVQCMDHCLDDDKTEYTLWSDQREALIAVTAVAANNSESFLAHINRFNTHKIPIRLAIQRRMQCRALEEYDCRRLSVSREANEAHQAGLDEDEAVERAQEAFINRCEPEY